MNENFTPDEILSRPGRALFLFPDEASQELNSEFIEKYPGP
jgi:hypothetical protein